jgi:GNAT superfamily N-acetyltransferase
MSLVHVLPADLDNPAHQLAVVELTDAYSRDGMGAGKPLEDEVKLRLVPGLRAHPTTLIFLAYELDRPVGMAMCFGGFSSFAAKPLVNVHDLSVLADRRGKGIGKKLMQAVIEHARHTGCCKVTLETQERNHAAQRLYRSLGFEHQMYVEAVGGLIFMACPL